MSDEKLSEALEEEFEKLRFAAHADPLLGERLRDTDKILDALFRPLLARLERERDAARSEGLAEVVQICEYAARGTVEAMSQADRSEMWKIIAQQSVEQYESIVKRIRSLAPSVVSQPSRERKVLEEALMITELFVACRKRADVLHPKYSCAESNGELDTVVSYDREEGEHLDDVCGRCKLLKVLRAALAGATPEEGAKETKHG